MREYKFRGRSIEPLVGDDQWLYGFGVHVVEYTDGGKEYWLYTDNGPYQVDPETVGQYIGLPDRKERDIYEDDVVKVEDKYVGVVKFNEHDLSYVIEDNTGGYGFINGQTYDEWPEYRTYEIVGNIHDNPDLLEGEKK